MSVKNHSPNVKFDDIPGSLPTATVPDHADLAAISKATVAKLPQLQHSDLTSGAVWRDYLSLTGYLRTFYSSQTIVSAFDTLKRTRHPSDFQVTPDSWRIAGFGPTTAWIDIGFTFQTNGELRGNCAGIVSVVHDQEKEGEWRVWMLRTWLENFEGHGDPDTLEPAGNLSNGSADGHASNGHTNGEEKSVFGAVIIGGGQAGLSCAGRLKALGVSYVLIERNEQVGDVWRNRYDTLRWHTSKEYGNLPFDRTYLPEDDYMLTTKMIASGHSRWAERFGINVMLGTSVLKAIWDELAQTWSVTVSPTAGQEEIITARNLVLSIGGGAAVPVSPEWPGREEFGGTAVHSIDYKTAEPWRGKKGVVIGTANTGHDVAEDMVNAGLKSVTMVQRGATFVFPAEWLHKAEDMEYNLETPTATADRRVFTYPNKIMREFTNRAVFNLIDSSPERFDALERAGFRLERKGDIYDNLYVRFGGHYVDIGTSDRIVKGQIKMKTEEVKEWTEDGLRFADGSELKADLVVLATGFHHDFRKSTREILGEVADQVDDYWGMDREGEIRGAFKPAGHPCLYYHGGDVRLGRWFSRFVALQIQADVLGKRLQPYLDTPL